MKLFVEHSGLVSTLDRVNVDTDQIIPKQFLKRIERTGFGAFLFNDWRFLPDGSINPDFELNKPEFQGSTILLTRANFGCGSSREHAPWALEDYGFRAIIALSFADIFFNNCFKNGLLPVSLPEDRIEELFTLVRANTGYRLTVNLEDCKITDEEGLSIGFEIDPFRRDCLLKGLDDIGLTLEHEDRIAEYKARRRSFCQPDRSTTTAGRSRLDRLQETILLLWNASSSAFAFAMTPNLSAAFCSKLPISASGHGRLGRLRQIRRRIRLKLDSNWTPLEIQPILDL